MITTMTVQVRVFPVAVFDERTGGAKREQIVLTKEQLQAAQLVGQSSKELIYRLYNRQGFRVLEIYAPEKREITLDLEELYRAHSLHERGKREAGRILGHGK